MQQSLIQDTWLMVVRCGAYLHMFSLFVTGNVEVAGSLFVDVPSCGSLSLELFITTTPPLPPHTPIMDQLLF